MNRIAAHTLIILIFLIASFSAQSQQYQVGLLNGKKYSGNNIKWKTPFLGKQHILINDSLKVLMDQVSFYEVKEGYYKKFASPKAGSIDFYKRELGGERINVFTIFVNTSSYDAGTGMQSFNRSKIYWYEKERSDLMKLNYKNLLYDLSDNPASMDVLKKVHGMRVATGLFYAVGAGLLIAGIVDFTNTPNYSGQSQANHSSGSSTLFVAGAVCFAVPLIINIGKRDKLLQAIELYNMPLRN